MYHSNQVFPAMFFLMCIFLWFMITVNAIQALRWLIGDKSWNLKWPNGRYLVQFLTVLFLLESRILQNVYVLLFDFWASFYTQDKFSVAILFCYSGFKVKWNAFHTYLHTYIHTYIHTFIYLESYTINSTSTISKLLKLQTTKNS